VLELRKWTRALPSRSTPAAVRRGVAAEPVSRAAEADSNAAGSGREAYDGRRAPVLCRPLACVPTETPSLHAVAGPASLMLITSVAGLGQ